MPGVTPHTFYSRLALVAARGVRRTSQLYVIPTEDSDDCIKASKQIVSMDIL